MSEIHMEHSRSYAELQQNTILGFFLQIEWRRKAAP